MKKETVYKIFSKLPELETNRLRLRKILPLDMEDMYEYSSSELVTKYLTWYPHRNMEFTKNYIDFLQTQYNIGSFWDWAVIFKENSKMIGTCGFTSFDYHNNTAEVGYVFNNDYWGIGIAPEALREVIKFGFEKLSLHRIEGKYIASNYKSRLVMEKCGMKYEGIRRGAMVIKGGYRDIGVCALLSSDIIET